MSQHEAYPSNWINLNLMINKDTLEYHIIGGDRDPGEGDRHYVGADLLLRMIHGDNYGRTSEI